MFLFISITAGSSALNEKNVDDFFLYDQLLTDPIVADSSAPYVLLALHLFDVAAKRIIGQITDSGQKPLRVLTRNLFEKLIRRVVNL